MSESVKDPNSGTDKAVTGAQVRIPVVRRQTYDTGKYIDHKSLGKDISVSMTAAAGLSVALNTTTDTVEIEVIPGTTTLADIAAAVALDAAVAEVYSATGIAGTIPLGFTSYSADLWVDVYAGASLMLVLDEDGNAVPFSGKSIVMEVKSNGLVVGGDSVQTVLTAPDGTPHAESGTLGKIPVDWTESYGTGCSIVWHPKVNGVRVVESLGGGALAASATGRTVTVVNVNAGTTTAAQIAAAVAADADSAALLVGNSPTGTTDAGYVGNTGHDLESDGYIAPNAKMILWPDGYFRPAEADATGGEKVSLSSRLYSEDPARGTMRVETQGTSSGRKSASDVIMAAGIAGTMQAIYVEAGGGGITLELRKDGVVGGDVILSIPLGAGISDTYDLHDWPITNGLYVKIAAGGGFYNVKYDPT